MQNNHLNDNNYLNRVKVDKSLSYLKAGIINFCDDKARDLHEEVTKRVVLKSTQAATTWCNNCTNRSIIKIRGQYKMNCANNICNVWFEEIQALHQWYPHFNLKSKSDPQIWPTDSWEVAKCFQSIGSSSSRSAEDSDVNDLLLMIKNCSTLATLFPDKSTVSEVNIFRG